MAKASSSNRMVIIKERILEQHQEGKKNNGKRLYIGICTRPSSSWVHKLYIIMEIKIIILSNM